MDINDAKTIVGFAIAVCIVVLILIGLMCWKYFLSPTNTKSDNPDTDKLIREVLEENDYKYEVSKTNDTSTTYTLWFSNDSVDSGIRVINNREKSYSYFFSYCDYKYGDKLTIVDKASVLKAVNDYNDRSIFVTAILRKDNNIEFNHGYIYDGGGFTKEAFDQILHIVLREANEETPKIFHQAGINTDTPLLEP